MYETLVDTYRKPATTDLTINFLSNHSMEQKMAAFRFHVSRMHSLPLDPDKKQKEWKTIQTIAKNNNYLQQLLQEFNRQKELVTHKPRRKTRRSGPSLLTIALR
jgi:hypothetical protein